MPRSVEEGKQWSLEQVTKIPHDTILDVGPGEGRYSKLLRNLTKRMDAVEIWIPYINTYNLLDKYDCVIPIDYRQFQPSIKYDITIFGDVLEHMDDPYIALNKAKQTSRYILLSVPTIDYPQGIVEGNPYEEHRYQFYPPEIAQMEGLIAYQTFEVVTVALLNGYNHDQ